MTSPGVATGSSSPTSWGWTLTLSQSPRPHRHRAAHQGALQRRATPGLDGDEIDHIELTGPSSSADARNFVLCPGGAYDRSPCGTGTSAKLACLAADGKTRGRAQSGARRASPAAALAPATARPAGIVAASRAGPSSPPRRPCSDLPADPFADGISELPGLRHADPVTMPARIAAG